MSTTIGDKGGSVNIGKDGIYGNAGIPGTGIYTREKIHGRKKGKCSNEEPEELTGFSFGCVTFILSIAVGAFFGFVFGHLWLTMVFAPIIFIAVYITRMQNKTNEEEETVILHKKQEAAPERVHLSTLFKYKSVIDQDTLTQLKEYQQMGAKSVNIPKGTLNELKRRFLAKETDENEIDNDAHNEPSDYTPVEKIKTTTPKVQSYEKWEKKVQKKKAKTAMEIADYIYLSIEDANELFIHNSSADEMKLLDIILDAKLDGRESIKIDRTLYERLKSVKSEHCKSL